MIHSFLMIGQSNMAGRGLLNDVPKISDPRLLMLRNGRFMKLSEPVNYDRPFAGVGPAPIFAKRLLATLPPEDAVGLIPCADGGTALCEWQEGSVLFDHAIAQAQLAMRSSTLKGILWHQGEGDCENGGWACYGEELTRLFAALRSRLGPVPIVVGSLGDFLADNPKDHLHSHYRAVNEALFTLAREHKDIGFADAAGLTSHTDLLHFDAVSARELGVRYFEAYQSLMAGGTGLCLRSEGYRL